MENVKGYKVGYVRVSTEEQDIAIQMDAMKRYGVEKVFVEKVSGKNTDRKQLNEMLDFIRSGDAVIVYSFSRLARNTRDLLKLVDTFREKGVDFVSVKETIDTTTPQGYLMLSVFAAIYQFEREQILQRQQEGINLKKAMDAELKAQGKKAKTYKGRQPISTDADQMREVCSAWRAGDMTAREAMQRLNLKPNTFYRRVKELGLK